MPCARPLSAAALRTDNWWLNDSIRPEQLDDEELARAAVEWRRRALSGQEPAYGVAHELERELRRRKDRLSTLCAEMSVRAEVELSHRAA